MRESRLGERVILSVCGEGGSHIVTKRGNPRGGRCLTNDFALNYAHLPHGRAHNGVPLAHPPR